MIGLAQTCIFVRELLSLSSFLWTYRGQYILVASFVLCQHVQGKHSFWLFFHSLSHILPPFTPFSSPSQPLFFNLHSHSLHLDSVSFFRLRDESRPMVPFTSPEAAQMRWLIWCFPLLLLTDRHGAHKHRTRADQHSCLPISLCTCTYASYNYMQRWIIRETALQTWWAWRHSRSGGKSKGLALWYEMPDVRSPRVVTWLWCLVIGLSTAMSFGLLCRGEWGRTCIRQLLLNSNPTSCCSLHPLNFFSLFSLNQPSCFFFLPQSKCTGHQTLC